MFVACGLKVKSKYEDINDPRTYTESEKEVYDYWAGQTQNWLQQNGLDSIEGNPFTYTHKFSGEYYDPEASQTFYYNGEVTCSNKGTGQVCESRYKEFSEDREIERHDDCLANAQGQVRCTSTATDSKKVPVGNYNPVDFSEFGLLSPAGDVVITNEHFGFQAQDFSGDCKFDERMYAAKEFEQYLCFDGEGNYIGAYKNSIQDPKFDAWLDLGGYLTSSCPLRTNRDLKRTSIPEVKENCIEIFESNNGKTVYACYDVWNWDDIYFMETNIEPQREPDYCDFNPWYESQAD